MRTKQRFLKALNNEKADRLPVTTHHLMPYYLDKYVDGKSSHEFFSRFGLDEIQWEIAFEPDVEKGEYYDPTHLNPGFLEARRICTDQWFFNEKIIKEDNSGQTKEFSIITPEKTLSMILKTDIQSTWVLEPLVKEKNDIEVIAKYAVHPKCNKTYINNVAARIGDDALLRSHILCFDGYGQPGCWQDASCLFGIENLIMATFEDPEWVHSFVKILQERKMTYIKSLRDVNFDLIELGGGDASTTVISPDIFDNFVAPYDSPLIETAQSLGQRISYHTCGGMMPILESIAAMKPIAMETFTPAAMGGDVNLAEAKKRIGDKVCMIGGFDQFNFFKNTTPEETRAEVRRCFDSAGQNGGYILSPSDHFFDADPELVFAFADEARKCIY